MVDLLFLIFFIVLMVAIAACLIILFLLKGDKNTIPKSGTTLVVPTNPTPVDVTLLPNNAIGTFASQKVGNETFVTLRGTTNVQFVAPTSSSEFGFSLPMPSGVKLPTGPDFVFLGTAVWDTTPAPIAVLSNVVLVGSQLVLTYTVSNATVPPSTGLNHYRCQYAISFVVVKD